MKSTGTALCIASSGLLVKASQVDGDVCYSKFSVTLLSEALKLAISSALWLREVRQRPLPAVLVVLCLRLWHWRGQLLCHLQARLRVEHRLSSCGRSSGTNVAHADRHLLELERRDRW